MPNSFTNTTFNTTYKDDFRDSDNYHRILFNSGRGLQARELTQMQTITQSEIERLGRHLFKEGSQVNIIGLTVDTEFEFVKLETSDTTGFAVGDLIEGLTSGITAKIVRIEAATDAGDPATFYISYRNSGTSPSGSTVTAAARFTPGEFLQRSGSATSIRAQVFSDSENPAVGRGTKVSVSGGSIFVRGHFVTVNPQTILVSKYSDTPNEVIGMRYIEDIVTVDDTNDLYDNQNNGIPNLTAPGADRYRIRLFLSVESQISATDNFFAINRLVDGEFRREVDVIDYDILEREMAKRTSEESGNYVVEGFNSTIKNGDSDRILNLQISPGIAYVEGFRVAINTDTTRTINKPRTTTTVGETIAANYGNYLIVDRSGPAGFVPNVESFQQLTLKTGAGWTSTNVGTARVRSVTRDGDRFRLYLFDIQIADGQKFTEARSIGLNSNEYFNIVTEGGVAVIKEAVNNNLFFSLAHARPQRIDPDSINITVQRRYSGTTNGSGVLTLPTLASGESYTDQTQWIVATNSGSREIQTDATASGNQVNTSVISGDIEVLAFVSMTDPAVTIRPKTRRQVTENHLTINEDADGLKYLKLNNPDIINVSSILDSDTGTSISNRFSLDDGQRDNFYYNGRLVLRNSAKTPTGNVKVSYTHFEHGAGNFFAVNSYDVNDIAYADIPNHTQRNGEVIELRNVLDFRSYKESDGADYVSSFVNELPQNTDGITSDVIYYEGRRDLLVLDKNDADFRKNRNKNTNIKYITGLPTLGEPVAPYPPAGTIVLKEFILQPWTDNNDDLGEYFVENRRFTMRDISEIVNRVATVEEAVTLNLLETETANLEILDSEGNNRFKSGFFADNFTNFDRSDIEDPEYSALLDLQEGYLTPDAIMQTINLRYDSDNTQNINAKYTDHFITLDYTEENLITQDLASETENINPFEVVSNVGTMKLEPSIDTWFETRRRTLQTVRRTRHVTRGTASRFRVGTTETTTSRSTRLVNTVVEIAPFCRARLVRFRAEGLKPLTRMFLFFDGELLTNPAGNNYTREETLFVPFQNDLQDEFIGNTGTTHPQETGGSDLYTDARGEIIGSFLVPNNEEFQFRTGPREVKLLDISVNNNAGATCSASAIYDAQGTTVTQRFRTTIQTNTITYRFNPAPRDPLAQSFIVDNPQGAFLTSIDTYFATKPDAGSTDENVPVQLELRPLRNGLPAQDEIVGGSEVVKLSSDINVPALGDSDDLTAVQAIPTRFTFDAPVYLEGNVPYAFCLRAETLEYNVYVAKAGDFILGRTDTRIRQQPSLGSLFMSQNAVTWTPDQTRDMMFKINRAKFDISRAGNAIIENLNVPRAFLDADPIAFDNGSNLVKIEYLGHGLGVTDTVEIFGIDSNATFGGIRGTSLQGVRDVTAIDGRYFQIQVDSVATANVIGGGNGLSFTNAAQMDQILPAIRTFYPTSSTTTTFTGTFAKGRSIVSEENGVPNDEARNTFQISDAIPIAPFESVHFDYPQVAANQTTEDSAVTLGASISSPRKSVNLRATLQSTDDYLSPVIDVSQSSLIAINNLIDNQDSASNVFPTNVPLFDSDFVPETDPREGSHLSKHLSKPVTLETPAVGLKIILGANRPAGADFDVYYRTTEAGADINILDVSYILAAQDTLVQTDESREIFRDYEYTIGGPNGTLNPFTSFQIKIVMRSSNSAKVPMFRDLRAIALGT